MKPKNILFSLFIMTALAAGGGCENDSSTDPPPDGGGVSGLYGTGELSYESTGIDDSFDVSGSYKPSNLFALDTLGSGAGGFAADTSLFGKKIDALIAAYDHSFNDPVLNERHLLIAISDSASIPRAGNYPVSYQNKTTTSSAAYIYFLLSDSANFYQMFIPKSGLLTVSSYDPGSRRITGSFHATMYGNPPDTSREISMINGSFSIFLAGEYFNY